MISITITSDNAERIREELRTFLNDQRNVVWLPTPELTEAQKASLRPEPVGGIDRTANPMWRNPAVDKAVEGVAAAIAVEEKALVEAAVEGHGEKPTVAEAPKRRGRPSKAAQEAERAAAAQALLDKLGSPEGLDVNIVAESPRALTYEGDLRSAVTAVVGEDGAGVARARELLAEFGVTRLRELPETRWAGFVARAAAIVGGAS